MAVQLNAALERGVKISAQGAFYEVAKKSPDNKMFIRCREIEMGQKVQGSNFAYCSK